MSVIILLLIASICIAGAFLAAFIWSVRTGQFDDEYSPPLRMLFDDEKPTQDKNPTITT
jgi:cbb3-type cytochrome oxidase maturation protein